MLGLDRGRNTSIQCHQSASPGASPWPHFCGFSADQPLFADLRAGALRLGEGGGSDDEGAGSAAAARVAAATVGVDFDSGIDFESGAAVSAFAP